MKKKDLTPQEKLTHNPFAALQKAGGSSQEPVASSQGEPAKIKSKTNPTETKPKRVVLRMERKGHGGKEMTRVEKLTLTSTLLEAWLKEIKQSLGCGGVIDGEDLLIQGDQRDRLAAFFTKKGIVVQS